ncbi:MAG: hypothetical protein EAZ55_01655 [Cytophagales bacterium]|nr:MAG: hypothetical protein EAZ55_01655 [Cytophagales bacterium]
MEAENNKINERQENSPKHNEVEFEALIFKNGKPTYVTQKGTFQDWTTHPQDASVIAIIRDKDGKMHMKRPEDVKFITHNNEL